MKKSKIFVALTVLFLSTAAAIASRAAKHAKFGYYVTVAGACVFQEVAAFGCSLSVGVECLTADNGMQTMFSAATPWGRCTRPLMHLVW